MPIIDTWDAAIRADIYAAWSCLPPDVQRRLDHIRFTVGMHPERKAYASAGISDIDIRRLPLTTPAAVSVLLHEIGHVAGDHARRLNSGEITVQEAEREADVFARRYGARELDARRDLIGR